MSVIRFINDQNRGIDSLHKIIRYVTREGRIKNELQKGIGIFSDDSFEEMKFMRKMFHAEAGKMYQHLVVSNSAMLKDPAIAHQIAMRIASFYGNEYQVLVCTHTDTENLHSHLVINTINVLEGKRLSQNKNDLEKLRNFANGIFAEYGLPLIGENDIFFVEYDECEETDPYYELCKESEVLEEEYEIIRPIKFLNYEEEAKELREFQMRMESYKEGS